MRRAQRQQSDWDTVGRLLFFCFGGKVEERGKEKGGTTHQLAQLCRLFGVVIQFGKGGRPVRINPERHDFSAVRGFLEANGLLK